MRNTDRWLADRPALRLLGKSGGAEPKDGIIVHSGAEAEAALRDGFPPESIFFFPPFDMGAARLRDSCRFAAGSLEDLLFLERMGESGGAGGLYRVGLRLRAPELPPAEGPAFPDITAELAREIRAMRHLTVRGCFFCGNLAGADSEALGRFFRAGYEAAKRMTVTLPCAMPYLCFENAAAAVRKSLENHPEAAAACLRPLDTVIMQNETAFYAKLYLS